MKARITLLLAAVFLVLAPALPANAACFNPAGNAGDVRLNKDYSVMQYCNGGTWVSMGGSVGGDTTTGLLSWWKLDASSGMSALDSTGNGYAGTLTNGPVWQPTGGKLNGALQFDGSNDYVNIPSYPVTTADLTITAWVKRASLTGGYDMMVTKGNVGDTLEDYFFYLKPSGGPIVFEADAVCQFPGSEVTGNTNVDMSWHHVAVTRSGTTVTLYLDGAPDKTATVTAADFNDRYPIIFGWDQWGYHFKGLLDDVRIYNRALSAADITTLYNSTGGPIHWWKFDEGSGATAVDSAGEANATLSGTTAFTGSGKFTGGLGLPDDGTSKAASLTAPADILNASKLTLSAWVRLAQPTSDIVLGQQSGGPTFFDSIGIEVDGGGQILLDLDSASNTSYATMGATSVSDTNWHLVTMVFDGTQAGDANRLKGYLDGAPQTLAFPATGIPAATTTNALPFYFGKLDGGEISAGTVDDFRIYSRALSAPEVLALYASAACASPVGAAGDVIYNAGTYHVPQFCNGAGAWVPMGKVPGLGGGGCSSPTGSEGDTMYSSAYRVMQYCDGTSWRAAGGNVPISGLVAWWNFDEGSGTSAADSSGNGNTGTLTNGATWTTSGKFNNALTLTAASSQYVDVTDVASLRLAGSWTDAAWVKLNSLPTAGNFMAPGFVRCATNGAVNYGLGIDNGLEGAETGWFVSFDTAAAPGTDLYAKYEVTPGTGVWYHLAGVYDSAAQTLTLYLNGVLVAGPVSVTGSSPSAANGTNANIGGHVCGGGYAGGGYVDGTVDDARLYNRALSAGEVWRLYTGAPAP